MKYWTTTGCALAMLAAAVFTNATAAPGAASPETLRIDAPWARETAAGQRDGGGFMNIINDGNTADRLVSAASPASAAVQIHAVQMEQGMMRMRELPDGVPVPAAGRVELKPGSLHIMFIGLNHPLKAGDRVPVTLKFRAAGEKKVMFEVRSLAKDATPAR
ncbi:MAG: copper chaperone PCu(A)C [Steroidobacteraceae bacterium]